LAIKLLCHSGLDPRFDRLTALSKVEGKSSFIDFYPAWMPDQVRHDVQKVTV
jgi:hypothetical protein